ncbi:MAG: hypothetical protein JXB88_01160 [Spirochaetales bacterium]|nr:hypothetical protein [Spirochaetales bacterium]
MFKKRVISLVLIIASVFIFFSTGSADTDRVRPVLRLTVEQSPLEIYPPIMIYTAQLNYIPINADFCLKADFYNINEDSVSADAGYLGSAVFDKTGKAVLSKQIRPGKYIAIAKTKIYNRVIVSNKVEYIVR